MWVCCRPHGALDWLVVLSAFEVVTKTRSTCSRRAYSSSHSVITSECKLSKTPKNDSGVSRCSEFILS